MDQIPTTGFWADAVQQLPALAIFAAVTVFVVVRFLAFLSTRDVQGREERELMATRLEGMEARSHASFESITERTDRSAEETRVCIRDVTSCLGEVRGALRDRGP